MSYISSGLFAGTVTAKLPEIRVNLRRLNNHLNIFNKKDLKMTTHIPTTEKLSTYFTSTLPTRTIETAYACLAPEVNPGSAKQIMANAIALATTFPMMLVKSLVDDAVEFLPAEYNYYIPLTGGIPLVDPIGDIH